MYKALPNPAGLTSSLDVQPFPAMLRQAFQFIDKNAGMISITNGMMDLQ
ncbi:hypothetical protein J6TS7_34320 [Paenibacillus dendritiformis]|nr:hypothetical protein J6TS7_34320 [Paenibacillus dendritiformis]